MEKQHPGGRLLTFRITAVAVVFGGLALLTILIGMHFRIPGTGVITDPREIFVSIGAALTGPVGGLIVGTLASLGDPDPALRLYILASHLIGCLWIGWTYRRFVYTRRHILSYLVAWNIVLFVYYYVCALPVQGATWALFPDTFHRAFPETTSFLDAVHSMNQGMFMEYALTALTTTLLLLVLPEAFRRPLGTAAGVRSGAHGHGGEERRKVLGLRLTIWFLLFSLLPLAISGMFVRNTLRTMMLEQRALGEMELVRGIARSVASGREMMDLRIGLDSLAYAHTTWVVLDASERYVTHWDRGRVGRPASEDIPLSVLSSLQEGNEGFVEDIEHDLLVLYARVPGYPLRVVVMKPMDDTFTALRSFERDSIIRFAGVLLLMAIVAGVAIWIIIGSPMRRLALAVQRFGRGDRDVRVDTRAMTDEIEILGRSFNEMTENIGILHAGLEQEIRDRRMAEQALRSSEHKFHQMAELLPQPIFEADTSGRITFANRSAFSTFGYHPESLVRGVFFVDLVIPEERGRVRKDIERAIGGEDLLGYEYMMLRADGVAFPGLVHTGYVQGDHGPIGVRGIVVDITEQKRAAAGLRRALDEKEVLLKEVHHRVKNNLQIISSLLNLQADALNDPRDRALFKESESRVRSMALIHERLYKSDDFARVEFREYVDALVSSLFISYQRPEITSEVDIWDCQLPLDTAIPCGLIINELITNALKHAYPDGQRGKVTVGLHETDGDLLVLTVNDDGIGLPADVDPATTRTLGLNLVSILTRQLQGTLRIERNSGTAFRITFRNSAAPTSQA